MELGPPDTAALRVLDDDAWARLVGHARRVVRDLEGDDTAPEDGWQELRGCTTVELLSGRGRTVLEEQLAAGRSLWEGVADRLRGEDPDAWERRLAPVPADEPVPERDDRAEAEVRRRKERIRELTEERDRARRQLTGAEARARGAEDRVADLETQLRGAHERIEELEQELERAVADRDEALARQRRQHDAEVASLREELRVLRRAEDERRAEERRRAEAERAAARAEAQPDGHDRAGPARARPGRPSVLPQGVQPGTSAAVRALLTPRHTVLVDGYNLTRTHRGHVPLPQQRSWLVATLEGVAARFRCDVEVVFDATDQPTPGAVRSRSVRVRFSRPEVTADDEIALEVAAADPTQPIVVVTDDRELRDRVRSYGVDLLPTSQFLRAVE